MTTYLITGVNRGIGKAFVTELTQDRENLVIGTVRNEQSGKELLQLGLSNLKLIYVDVTDRYSTVEAAFKQLAQLAPNGIDVFIHNAGFGGPDFLPHSTVYDADLYDKVFSVNVSGAAKTYKAVYPFVFEKGDGIKKIIFISSIVASTGDLLAGANAYGASKAALNHFGKQVAVENSGSDKPAISSSITLLVHPGYVDTDMSVDAQRVFGTDIFISPEESVKRVLSTIDKATQKSTGTFVDEFGNLIGF